METEKSDSATSEAEKEETFLDILRSWGVLQWIGVLLGVVTIGWAASDYVKKPGSQGSKPTPVSEQKQTARNSEESKLIGEWQCWDRGRGAFQGDVVASKLIFERNGTYHRIIGNQHESYPFELQGDELVLLLGSSKSIKQVNRLTNNTLLMSESLSTVECTKN